MGEYRNISDYEIAQVRNIIGDDYLKAIDVLHDCAEMVGVCSSNECSEITFIPKKNHTIPSS